MSDEASSGEGEVGSIGWVDLTVADAERMRDFYAAVVGWRSSNVKMGDYSDFAMTTPGSGRGVAGICHARGVNAALPAQWLIYITVVNLERSMEKCRRLGGKVMCPPRQVGSYGRMCVIRDPAGAVAALMEPPKSK